MRWKYYDRNRSDEFIPFMRELCIGQSDVAHRFEHRQDRRALVLPVVAPHSAAIALMDTVQHPVD